MGGIPAIRGIGGIGGVAGTADGPGVTVPCWVAGGNRGFVAAGGLVSAVDGGGGCWVGAAGWPVPGGWVAEDVVRTLRVLVGGHHGAEHDAAATGVEISMILEEVEPRPRLV